MKRKGRKSEKEKVGGGGRDTGRRDRGRQKDMWRVGRKEDKRRGRWKS